MSGASDQERLATGVLQHEIVELPEDIAEPSEDGVVFDHPSSPLNDSGKSARSVEGDSLTAQRKVSTTLRLARRRPRSAWIAG